MSASSASTSPAAGATGTERRRGFGVSLGTHALHDGYTDVIYVLLPVWQAEFGLSYAALGLLRAGFAVPMAALQVPAAMLGERIGSILVLAVGTALSALCFVLLGFSAGLIPLALCLFIGGIGSATQHPIASAIVAHAYDGAGSRTALGTYNFAGDVGKVAVPSLMSLLLMQLSWREASISIGAAGIIAALAIYAVTPRNVEPPRVVRADPTHASAAVVDWRGGFGLLFVIGMIDTAIRMVFLTLLPFVLTGKGADLPTVGLALALVFGGGAAGKLVCAYLGQRIGMLKTSLVTEGLTALGILAVLALPLPLALAVLPLVGLTLNGTSSVLYGSVPELVTPQARTRAFSLFYTGVLGGGAVAPVLFGLLGDAIGLYPAVSLLVLLALATFPLAIALGPELRA